MDGNGGYVPAGFTTVSLAVYLQSLSGLNLQCVRFLPFKLGGQLDRLTVQ